MPIGQQYFLQSYRPRTQSVSTNREALVLRSIVEVYQSATSETLEATKELEDRLREANERAKGEEALVADRNEAAAATENRIMNAAAENPNMNDAAESPNMNVDDDIEEEPIPTEVCPSVGDCLMVICQQILGKKKQEACSIVFNELLAYSSSKIDCFFWVYLAGVDELP